MKSAPKSDATLVQADTKVTDRKEEFRKILDKSVTWHDVALELVTRPDFWYDILTAGGYTLVGIWSLLWERLSDRFPAADMFFAETTQIVTMGQVAAMGILGVINRDLFRSWLGKVVIGFNLYGLFRHVKRMKVSLDSAKSFENALGTAGIKNMKPALGPMLLALLVPLRSFLSKEEKKLLEWKQEAYADLQEIDPELYELNKNRSKRAKKLGTLMGRGRIAQWMTMDILRNKKLENSSNLPVLMYIHGGGWATGDKMFAAKSTLDYMAVNMDVVVCIINYRMSPEVSFPQQIYDCKRALYWIKQNISRYGGSPDKVFVAGESAGGNLTALLSLTVTDNTLHPPELTGQEDLSIRGAIDICGIHDLTDSEAHHANTNSFLIPDGRAGVSHILERLVFKKTIEEAKEEFIMGSPTHIIEERVVQLTENYDKQSHPISSLCPIMIVHGSADTLAAVGDSRAFYERLKRLRNATSSSVKDIYAEIPDAPHAIGYLPSPRAVSLAHGMQAFIEFHANHNAKL